MKRRFLFVPFVLTLASLLQLNYISSIVAAPGQVLRPLAVLWTLLCLLVWPAYWMTRDWNWATLLLTIFVLGFYSSSSFFSIVFAFVGIIAVFWLAFLRLRRAPVRLAQFINILTVVSVLLFGYTAVLEGAMLARIPWAGYRNDLMAVRSSSLLPNAGTFGRPDIYYIVLDGYAREDLLEELFQFNNSSVIASLEHLGFVVPDSSHSNYPATPLSIASTLNMDYVQTLVPDLGPQSHRWLMEPLIDRSRLRAVLESQGYQTVSISTNWTITDNATTDHYYHPFPVVLSDFESFLLDMTPLKILEPMLGRFASIPTAETHRQVVRYNFETLAALPDIPGPKFVFAHIISPHPPFVFDRNGKSIKSDSSFTFQDANEFPGSVREYQQKYVEQVRFVNDSLLQTIAEILAKSDVPPIIILQADHGSGLLTDLTSSEKTCIRERFSPFAAYYLPHVDAMSLTRDVSNVNLFRLVLNHYFDAGLPLLEDRQYFYRDMQTYYEFEDVTERLNESCPLR